jgi:xylulokinase
MLCALAGGFEAISVHGVEAQRLLLVGGAAQNPAVQTIAAQVFAAPVEVPMPGEYVAMGAAAQAAWVLSGARPTWAVETAGKPAVDTRPEILEAYQRAASRYVT